MTEPVVPPTYLTLEQNDYFLFTKEFTAESTGEAIRFILERNLALKKPKQIKMLINSFGGDLTASFALIDTMKGSLIPIHTYGLGLIASCGLFTFIAGEKGKRFITPNTSIMSHQFSWGLHGKEHELFSKIKEFNLVSKRIVEHFKRCTGLDEKQIREYLLPPEDRWLSAKEAVKLGLADEIVDFY